MKLKILPDNIIYEFIEHCYLAGQDDLIVILTNGESLCGQLRGQAYRFHSGDNLALIPASERCFSRKGHLELYYGGVGNEHSVFVPLSKIAGLHTLPYSQEEVRPGSHQYDDGSAHERLFQDLLAKAKKYRFAVERHWAFYSLIFVEPFDWGSIKFSGNAPLYSDWDYLQRITGGLNNIGVGVPIASISAGWSESLWHLFTRKVKDRLTALDNLCSKQEVAVQGFISFIEYIVDPVDSQSIKREKEGLEMEGTQWVAAAISDQRVLTARRLKSLKWALVYFKVSGFMFPVDLWDKIVQPVRIFAEVVPASISTQAGQLTCFLKCRAAAFVQMEDKAA